MALRLPIDDSCPNRRPCDDESDIPFAMRRPHTVHCRRGCNLDEVAAQALDHATSDILAAVGSGKSTLLPRALAKRCKTTVFAVVPHPLLAVQLYDYVCSQSQLTNDGVETFLLERGDAPIPETGVVYLSASTMTSIILQTSDASLIRDRVIFLDEAHESNAYSYVLRHLVVQLGARHLVRASATFTGHNFPMRETPGQVEEGEYDPTQTPDTWDVTDVTKPWYYGRGENTLIFTDSESQASLLKDKYEAVGCYVSRLTVKTSVEHFRAVCKRLSTSRQITVLILDYTFRSGFTFDATNVVDVGNVYFMSGKPRTHEVLSRSIYAFEREQTKGRVARLGKQRATYYRPKGELDSIRVELEGVEAEAAAYLYRLLGFKPTGELTERVLSKLYLPADVKLCDALNGPTPLTCLELTEKPEREEEEVITPSPAVEEKPPDKLTPEELYPEKVPERLDTVICDDWQSMVDRYNSYVEPDLICGQSYMPLHTVARMTVKSCALFPDGVQSIQRFAAKYASEENFCYRVSDEERFYALSEIANQYNATIIEAIAMRTALMRLLAKYDADPAVLVVREAVKKVAAESELVLGEQRMYFSIMRKFARSARELIPFEGLTSLMHGRVAYHTKAYEAILAPVFLMNTEAYVDSVTEQFNNLAIQEVTTPLCIDSSVHTLSDSDSDGSPDKMVSTKRSSVDSVDTLRSITSVSSVASEPKPLKPNIGSLDLRDIKFVPGTPIEAKVQYIDRRIACGAISKPYPTWYLDYKARVTLHTKKKPTRYK